jgi:hypothetical protein
MKHDEPNPEVLASGYVDDELTPDQRARVDADPALLALVERHRAARAAVGEPVAPLSPARRDAMVAAAMAATGAAATGAVAGAAAGNVVTFAPGRARRRWQVAAGVVAGAAALLVVGLILRPNGGNDDDSAAGGEATAQEAATAADTAAGSSGGFGAAPTTAAPAPNVAAATEAPGTAIQGRDAAGGAAAAEASTTTPPPAPASDAARPSFPATTAAAAIGLPDLGPLETRPQFIDAARPYRYTASPGVTGPCAGYPAPIATATYKGTPAYLVVVEIATNGNRVALVATDTCAVLVKVDLAEA